MFAYRFTWREKISFLVMKVDAPYEALGDYFNMNVLNAAGAEEVLDLLRPVLDGRVPHFSGSGNLWWWEAGPVTTRIGHHYEPGLELEIPTRRFLELHEVYRDVKRADAAKRRGDGG